MQKDNTAKLTVLSENDLFGTTLLEREIECHKARHAHGLTVDVRRLKTPTTRGVLRGGAEQIGSGRFLHFSDFALLINKHINGDRSGDTCIACRRRIRRRDALRGSLD